MSKKNIAICVSVAVLFIFVVVFLFIYINSQSNKNLTSKSNISENNSNNNNKSNNNNNNEDNIIKNNKKQDTKKDQKQVIEYDYNNNNESLKQNKKENNNTLDNIKSDDDYLTKLTNIYNLCKLLNIKLSKFDILNNIYINNIKIGINDIIENFNKNKKELIELKNENNFNQDNFNEYINIYNGKINNLENNIDNIKKEILNILNNNNEEDSSLYKDIEGYIKIQCNSDNYNNILTILNNLNEFINIFDPKENEFIKIYDILIIDFSCEGFIDYFKEKDCISIEKYLANLTINKIKTIKFKNKLSVLNKDLIIKISNTIEFDESFNIEIKIDIENKDIIIDYIDNYFSELFEKTNIINPYLNKITFKKNKISTDKLIELLRCQLSKKPFILEFNIIENKNILRYNNELNDVSHFTINDVNINNIKTDDDIHKINKGKKIVVKVDKKYFEKDLDSFINDNNELNNNINKVEFNKSLDVNNNIIIETSYSNDTLNISLPHNNITYNLNINKFKEKLINLYEFDITNAYDRININIDVNNIDNIKITNNNGEPNNTIKFIDNSNLEYTSTDSLTINKNYNYNNLLKKTNDNNTYYLDIPDKKLLLASNKFINIENKNNIYVIFSNIEFSNSINDNNNENIISYNKSKIFINNNNIILDLTRMYDKNNCKIINIDNNSLLTLLLRIDFINNLYYNVKLNNNDRYSKQFLTQFSAVSIVQFNNLNKEEVLCPNTGYETITPNTHKNTNWYFTPTFINISTFNEDIIINNKAINKSEVEHIIINYYLITDDNVKNINFYNEFNNNTLYINLKIQDILTGNFCLKDIFTNLVDIKANNNLKINVADGFFSKNNDLLNGEYYKYSKNNNI